MSTHSGTPSPSRSDTLRERRTAQSRRITTRRAEDAAQRTRNTLLSRVENALLVGAAGLNGMDLSVDPWQRLGDTAALVTTALIDHTPEGLRIIDLNNIRGSLIRVASGFLGYKSMEAVVSGVTPDFDPAKAIIAPAALTAALTVGEIYRQHPVCTTMTLAGATAGITALEAVATSPVVQDALANPAIINAAQEVTTDLSKAVLVGGMTGGLLTLAGIGIFKYGIQPQLDRFADEFEAQHPNFTGNIGTTISNGLTSLRDRFTPGQLKSNPLGGIDLKSRMPNFDFRKLPLFNRNNSRRAVAPEPLTGDPQQEELTASSANASDNGHNLTN